MLWAVLGCKGRFTPQIMESPPQSVWEYCMFMCKVEGLLLPLSWKTHLPCVIIGFLYLLHLNSQSQNWNYNLHNWQLCTSETISHHIQQLKLFMTLKVPTIERHLMLKVKRTSFMPAPALHTLEVFLGTPGNDPGNFVSLPSLLCELIRSNSCWIGSASEILVVDCLFIVEDKWRTMECKLIFKVSDAETCSNISTRCEFFSSSIIFVSLPWVLYLCEALHGSSRVFPHSQERRQVLCLELNLVESCDTQG